MYPRLVFRPGPSRDSPTGRDLLQGQRNDGAGLADRLPLLLVSVVRGNDDIGAICSDIYMRRLAERDHSIGNAILLRIGLEVAAPLRAGPWTVPLVGRKFIQDGCLIGADSQHHLGVAFIETIYELTNRREHGGLCRPRSLRG